MSNEPLQLEADINMVTYKPLLCKQKEEYTENDFLSGKTDRKSSFYLNIDGNKIAVSRWVSPKRTRSYPFERVYDTMDFSGIKVTIIPVVKDEGFGGDQDYLQWDTVSLMSLINVYVIPAYYVSAKINSNIEKPDTITDQRVDNTYIIGIIKKIINTKQSALVWNLEQIKNLDVVLKKAIESYEKISQELQVKIHSSSSKLARLKIIQDGMDEFCKYSRIRAKISQHSESHTIQPKEEIVEGQKAEINIRNHLGGKYYLTCDEVEIHGDTIHLIEAKHSKRTELPSRSDILDAFFKMILYTNLDNIVCNGITYRPQPVLKMTSSVCSSVENLSDQNKKIIELYKKEAATQNSHIMISFNNRYLQ